MFFKFIFLLATCLHGARSACDEKYINAINTFWNKKPPTDILKTYDGIWTTIMISGKVESRNAGIKCVLEVAHGSKATVTDYWYFKDPKKDFTSVINQIEKDGKITEQYQGEEYNGFEDYMYVLYFEGGVMGFWGCSENGFANGMSGVAVKDYAKIKDNAKTKEAIQKAVESLKKAGLPDVETIPTECPADPTADVDKKTT